MADEIVTGVFVGGLESVPGFDGFKLCVLEACNGQPPDEMHVPILAEYGKATPQTLENVATAIDNLIREAPPVLVHCGAGVERSPLAVAWWLHSRRGLPLTEAYQLIAERHPPTQDRTFWIAQPAD